LNSGGTCTGAIAAPYGSSANHVITGISNTNFTKTNIGACSARLFPAYTSAQKDAHGPFTHNPDVPCSAKAQHIGTSRAGFTRSALHIRFGAMYLTRKSARQGNAGISGIN
jgi:hypothetical protein